MPPAGMTDDEARDLFSAYHDRELPPERHDAVRAALEANPELKREYDGFARMMSSLQSMAEAAGPVGPAKPADDELAAPAPDLLKGVQSRIKSRSRGKFYGDRWSRAAGIAPLELIALGVLLILAMAWFAMTGVDIRPAPAPAPAPSSQPAR